MSLQTCLGLFPALIAASSATTRPKPRTLSVASELLANRPCDPDPALDSPLPSPTVTAMMQNNIKKCSLVRGSGSSLRADNCCKSEKQQQLKSYSTEQLSKLTAATASATATSTPTTATATATTTFGRRQTDQEFLIYHFLTLSGT